MNKRSLLTNTIFGLTIMMSSHTYAISGEGFKIVSESVKSSPGFNFKVQELTSKKKNANLRQATAQVKTKDQKGFINEHIKIDAYHKVYISNDTEQTEQYTYVYTLHCYDSYGEYRRTIELEPHGHFSTNDYSYGDVQYQAPADFKIMASTGVYEDTSDDYQNDEATLTIVKKS